MYFSEVRIKIKNVPFQQAFLYVISATFCPASISLEICAYSETWWYITCDLFNNVF